jgi:hypothetical protein
MRSGTTRGSGSGARGKPPGRQLGPLGSGVSAGASPGGPARRARPAPRIASQPSRDGPLDKVDRGHRATRPGPAAAAGRCPAAARQASATSTRNGVRPYVRRSDSATQAGARPAGQAAGWPRGAASAAGSASREGQRERPGLASDSDRVRVRAGPSTPPTASRTSTARFERRSKPAATSPTSRPPPSSSTSPSSEPKRNGGPPTTLRGLKIHFGDRLPD